MVSSITARSRIPYLPLGCSEALQTVKSFVNLAVLLLKVKSFDLPPGKLVVGPEVGGSDLCVVDSSYM